MKDGDRDLFVTTLDRIPRIEKLLFLASRTWMWQKVSQKVNEKIFIMILLQLLKVVGISVHVGWGLHCPLSAFQITYSSILSLLKYCCLNYRDQQNLRTLFTSSIVPADLNSFLFQVGKQIFSVKANKILVCNWLTRALDDFLTLLILAVILLWLLAPFSTCSLPKLRLPLLKISAEIFIAEEDTQQIHSSLIS